MPLHLSNLPTVEVKANYGNVEGKNAFNVYVEAIVPEHLEITDTDAPKAVREKAIKELADKARELFVVQLTKMVMNKTVKVSVTHTEEPEEGDLDLTIGNDTK